jgi:glycosyltransferase involved in cell wall biosynthesis
MKKILIVQRVLTRYRYEVLSALCSHCKSLSFVTSQGDESGALKIYKPKEVKSNITVHYLNAMKFLYRGESREFSLFFYPQVLKYIKGNDIIIIEGTTNILNNIFIIPFAKMMGKKLVWWDSGYSIEKRTFRRQVIDLLISIFVKLTDVQLAYSTKAAKHMQRHMGASNCKILLNTINTDYFSFIQNNVRRHIANYQFNPSHIKLLFVGAIEKRKKVKELIDIVCNLNLRSNHRKYSLTIIGGGAFLEELSSYVSEDNLDFIEVIGPVYDKEQLKHYYFQSDLFILPGDGGLAIVQSLLFGLPVVCVSADGTEEDYIEHREYILNNLNELEDFLFNLQNVKGIDYQYLYEKVNSDNFIQKLIGYIEK